MTAIAANLNVLLATLSKHDEPDEYRAEGDRYATSESDAEGDRRTAQREDANDVARTLAGDGEAFARIVRRYQPLLGRRMARFSRDVGEVEMLVHDVFVEAYISLPKYSGTAPLEHWLQRIGTRVGYRFWTRRRRAIAPIDDRVAAQPSGDVERRDEVAHLRQAVDRLPARDRLVVTLLYLDAHSVAETARLTGWSQTMVKVQAFRARAKLRKAL